MPFAPDTAAQIAADFDLRRLPTDFFADPYPYYDALREHVPVKRMPDGSYFLTRFADLDYVYKNPQLFSSDKKKEFGLKYGATPLYEHHTTSLVFNDPPLHTRVRRLIAGALTPRAVAQLEPGLVTLVDRLLEQMATKREVDLIADFASAIPVEIIGNLLGVPHDERNHLRDWSLAILGALEPVLSAEQFDRGNRATQDFCQHLDGLIARRRAAPGEPEHDVLTRLTQGEEGGERLSALELVHNCIFLLNAGHETTTNLIGNGLVLLLQRSGLTQQLQEQPELVKNTVEEILRFESSNQLGNRITAQPVEIGGVAMPAGTLITLCIGAANRDPAQFESPTAFDITRSPNHHMAFAAGIHMCVGMKLARLEGMVAIARFLQRFPAARLVGSPVRGGRVRFRGFVNIPCRVEG
ncbi:MAG: cytochrome P450 [Rhodoferax sp.]